LTLVSRNGNAVLATDDSVDADMPHVSHERSDNAIRSQSRSSGAGEKYLVRRQCATKAQTFCAERLAPDGSCRGISSPRPGITCKRGR
jgi:hypothetical protein